MTQVDNYLDRGESSKISGTPVRDIGREQSHERCIVLTLYTYGLLS